MKWPEVNLDQVLSLEYGSALPERDRDSSGFLPVLGSNGVVGYHTRALVPGPGVVVGRKGSSGKVTWIESDFWPIDTTYYVSLKTFVNLRWIFYLLNFLNLEQLSIVTGVPGLNRNDAYKLRFVLPPPSEQHRIVEILDQADALRKKRTEAGAKAERILPALFIKMFRDPVGWVSETNTKLLGSVVEIQSGGTPSKQNPDFWKGEVPWVSPKDMKQDILFDATDHISRSAVEQTNLKYVDPGAVLIVVRGMILAHTVPIALAGCQLTINQDMKALQPKRSDIDSAYLYAALKASSSPLLSQVRTAAHGTRKLDTDEFLRLPILIPPPQDLEKFRRRMTRCQQIMSGVKKTEEMFDRLFETLLYRAFSGDLTAKWREAHMKELLAEMEEQARYLNSGVNDRQKAAELQGSLF